MQVGFNRRFDPGFVELRNRIASGVIGDPMLAHCVHRNVDVPPSWTSETTVLSSLSHEIDVMPWIFSRDVTRANWMSPIAPTPGILRDPQVVILELDGGPLIIVELFVTSGYGNEVKIAGSSGLYVSRESCPSEIYIFAGAVSSLPRFPGPMQEAVNNGVIDPLIRGRGVVYQKR